MLFVQNITSFIIRFVSCFFRHLSVIDGYSLCGAEPEYMSIFHVHFDNAVHMKWRTGLSALPYILAAVQTQREVNTCTYNKVDLMVTRCRGREAMNRGLVVWWFGGTQTGLGDIMNNI